MPETLITISVLDSGTEIPIAVVNWDETEDGDIETLASSEMLLETFQIKLNNVSGHDDETARWAIARTQFTYRDATDAERRGWQASYDEDADKAPIFLWDPRLLAH